MNQTELTEKVNAFPARIKEENIRITALSKSFASLGKAHQGKHSTTNIIRYLGSIKETNALMTLFQGMDHTKEISDNFL